MTIATQTLTQMQSLIQLYQSGYRSRTLDATIDKLVSIEQAHLQQEKADIESRLRAFEDHKRWIFRHNLHERYKNPQQNKKEK